MMFRSGEMVACIANAPCAAVTATLCVGQVYMIRTCRAYRVGHAIGVGVTLEEVRNGLNPIGDEYAYPVEWFRPVRQTDIGALRRIVSAVSAIES